MKILLLSDNKCVSDNIATILERKGEDYSRRSSIDWASPCEFDLIISAHSKEIFPAFIVNTTRCINIHPGLLPNERGWYPHIFSIAQGRKRTGCTIHEMDEKIDHGRIICQREVAILSSDTSESVYNRILQAEGELFAEFYDQIINEADGEYHSKRDFNRLCELNLNHVGTLEGHINLLRSLTHGDFNNAKYTKDGKELFIKISIS